MAPTRPIFAANWKMNHAPEDAHRFFATFLEAFPARDDRTVAFFPSAISLAAARAAAESRPDLHFGVQSIHWEAKGAFTGEVSAGMAAAAGARWALVGHSERRHLFGETDEQTGLKLRAALAARLHPVLCVGEMLEEREAGQAEEVVRRQMDAALASLDPGATGSLLIAYEPVWAIGTGRTASPADAAGMHAVVHEILEGEFGEAVAASIPILYGGSVKPDNVADLLAAPRVDGVLVGGASLDPTDFARICAAG